jgi:hypothetical protein
MSRLHRTEPGVFAPTFLVWIDTDAPKAPHERTTEKSEVSGTSVGSVRPCLATPGRAARSGGAEQRLLENGTVMHKSQ